MVLSAVNNLASLAAVNALNRTSSALETSQRRLATGYRITRAADDAAGLGISEGLRSQIGGMTQAVRNAQDGSGVLQIVDGALGDMTAVLQRMRALAVQAANSGALNPSAMAAIQTEFAQLAAQVDHISSTTNFDGIPLLDGTYDRQFQVGADVGETLRVQIGGPGYAFDRTGLGLTGLDVSGPAFTIPHSVTAAVSADQGMPQAGQLYLSGNWTDPGYESLYTSLRGTISYNGKTFDLGSVDYSGSTDYLLTLNQAAQAALGTSGYPFMATSSQLAFAGDTPGAGSTAADAVALTPSYTGVSGPDDAMVRLSRAIDMIGSARADLGAMQNRFEHTVDRLTESISDTTASESRIRDTDMAGEVSEMNRQQVLMQAGSAMLAQANRSTQTILKLLAA